MKRAAVLSLIFILSFGFFNVRGSKMKLQVLWQSSQSLEAKMRETDEIVVEEVPNRYGWIDAYSYLLRLLNKDWLKEQGIVRDEKNYLHYMEAQNGPKDVKPLVKRMEYLNRSLKAKNIKLLTLMPPDKYIPGLTRLKPGLPYNYVNETADAFLKAVAAEKIPILDFRTRLFETGLTYEESFYQTDHHWKSASAFWAYQQLAVTLEMMGILKEAPYVEEDQYNHIIYPNSFLGSQGRKVGMPYSGLDDFMVIYPKFETAYRLEVGQSNPSFYEGSFEEVVISPYVLNVNRSLYDKDAYAMYLNGFMYYMHLTNLKERNGPKLLFIKDSMSMPLISFLSTLCSEIYIVDPRTYEGNLIEHIESLDLDGVIVSIYPLNLEEQFFPFYEEMT